MLEALQIKNYKNFLNFEIDDLARINLIAGKNNTGKTSFLEALSVFFSEGDPVVLREILSGRGELSAKLMAASDSHTELNFIALKSLFNNRNSGSFRQEIEITGFTKMNDSSNKVEIVNQINPVEIVSMSFVSIDSDLSDKLNAVKEKEIEYQSNINQSEPGFLVISKGKSKVFLLNKNFLFRPAILDGEKVHPFRLVKTISNDDQLNARLFDSIALTDDEEAVAEALKIIDDRIERIAFVDQGYMERKPVVKIKGESAKIPLRSLGEGVNRIFAIILSLVNARNGCLLIDEAENGLHYSVQELLWKVILSTAHKLNVQVFATTHSSDCIYGFSQALQSFPEISGKLFRFDIKSGSPVVTSFNREELSLASLSQIEIR